MTKKTPGKDEILEALDFLLSVVEEHDKDLEKIVKELTSISKRPGEKGELSSSFGN